MMQKGPLKNLVLVLIVTLFCILREFYLELLIREDPGCGNLITFASFLFISIEGFIFTTKCGTVGPKVPFSAWTTLVVMYFLVSVTNNYALNFSISMPLHMIFRAGSLMANMILGMILLNKRYTTTKYLSVLMISCGIAICTIMSGKDINKSKPSSATNGTSDQDEIFPSSDQTAKDEAEASEELWEILNWSMGIAMLTFALFLSARMGIYQEVIYSKYGKHPKEALFYSHFLPLPGFILLGSNIYTHFIQAVNSPILDVPDFLEPLTPFSLPSALVYLTANVLTQYICISAVFVLTSECASLTVTLVVTLRKFLSLLFSIWYFRNPFTMAHWAGTVLVFAGTLFFSDVPGMIRSTVDSRAKDKLKKVE